MSLPEKFAEYDCSTLEPFVVDASYTVRPRYTVRSVESVAVTYAVIG